MCDILMLGRKSKVTTGCYVAAAGTTPRRTRGLRTATATILATGTTTSGSVVPKLSYGLDCSKLNRLASCPSRDGK